MLEFLGTQTIHIFVDSFTTDEGNEASLLVFRDEDGHWFVFNGWRCGAWGEEPCRLRNEAARNRQSSNTPLRTASPPHPPHHRPRVPPINFCNLRRSSSKN